MLSVVVAVPGNTYLIVNTLNLILAIDQMSTLTPLLQVIEKHEQVKVTRKGYNTFITLISFFLSGIIVKQERALWTTTIKPGPITKPSPTKETKGIIALEGSASVQAHSLTRKLGA